MILITCLHYCPAFVQDLSAENPRTDLTATYLIQGSSQCILWLRSTKVASFVPPHRPLGLVSYIDPHFCCYQRRMIFAAKNEASFDESIAALENKSRRFLVGNRFIINQ